MSSGLPNLWVYLPNRLRNKFGNVGGGIAETNQSGISSVIFLCVKVHAWNHLLFWRFPPFFSAIFASGLAIFPLEGRVFGLFELGRGSKTPKQLKHLEKAREIQEEPNWPHYKNSPQMRQK